MPARPSVKEKTSAGANRADDDAAVEALRMVMTAGAGGGLAGAALAGAVDAAASGLCALGACDDDDPQKRAEPARGGDTPRPCACGQRIAELERRMTAQALRIEALEQAAAAASGAAAGPQPACDESGAAPPRSDDAAAPAPPRKRNRVRPPCELPNCRSVTHATDQEFCATVEAFAAALSPPSEDDVRVRGGLGPRGVQRAWLAHLRKERLGGEPHPQEAKSRLEAYWSTGTGVLRFRRDPSSRARRIDVCATAE
jgi:hypothetical protein